MTTERFEHILGRAECGRPAAIRFFGRITESMTSRFNEEFDYLENVVRPSLIRVLINSEGGSVLYGMSSYSTIQNASVPTECIIEGMAASMASIVWAAADRSLMRDYGILMIHNPMLPGTEDDSASDMVLAFQRQIETIYRKRFGLGKTHVRAIMDGQAGKDGTYFDAAEAVRAGIIPAGNVIATTEQLREKARSSVRGLTDATAIREALGAVSAENKHFEAEDSILEQTTQDTMANDNDTQGIGYGAIAATLGMKDCEVKDVMARISELAAAEATLARREQELSDARTVLAGRETALRNLQKDFDAVTARLEKYEKQEAEQKVESIRSFLQRAADEGRIEAAAIPTWTEMAQTNFPLVQDTINSIPAREKISEQIASDPANVQAAVEAAKSAEELMAERVRAVVGDDFAFRKLQ